LAQSLQIKNDLVSLKEMKKDAARILPPRSIVRRLILSESDYLPREQAISKCYLYLEMLQKERR
jgi:hypothetical protein